MSTNTRLGNPRYPVTQHLIEKYQKYLLSDLSNEGENLMQGKKSGEGWTLRLHEKGSQQDESRWKLIFGWFKSLGYQLFGRDYEKRVLIDKIMEEKQNAISYDDWRLAGLRLDELTDVTKWKQKEESNLYDYELVRALTLRMRKARESEDYSQLLYTVRSTWVRNLGNMGNVNLYRHSHQGTKFLIDEYMVESELALEALLSYSDFDENYLLGILQQTRRNIGRTALVLSGGGTFGLFHIGVLATLFELDLLPRVISGSSAGAIVASIISAHHRDEIPELLEHVLEKEFNIFNDDSEKSESENFLIKISRFLKNGTWFDNKQLIRTMISFLGDLTFREAYNRTGKILNITVSPASLFEQPRLLNNLTAPNVLIWSAVCASCSLPGIFPSSPLYEKDPKTGETREWGGSSSVKFVDGSVDNDLPISRLSEMFNVDHVIACQVNVHIFPFLKISLSCVGGDIEDEFSARLKQSLSSIYSFMANEAIHILELGCELEVAKNLLTKLRSILSQQYSGDITILPDMSELLRISELLTNPSTGFLLRETANGARATWPKISIIQNHCGQEFALDKAITNLKGKIIVTSSIKNPLQFADTIPCRLVKARNKKKGKSQRQNKIGNRRLYELDDNLFESESVRSLLPMHGNLSTCPQPVVDAKRSLTFSLSRLAKSHTRRKSDTNARTKHTSRSFSLSFSSPKAETELEEIENVFPADTTDNLTRCEPYLRPHSLRSVSQPLRESSPLRGSSDHCLKSTKMTKCYPEGNDMEGDFEESSSMETNRTSDSLIERKPSYVCYETAKKEKSWDGRLEFME